MVLRKGNGFLQSINFMEEKLNMHLGFFLGNWILGVKVTMSLWAMNVFNCKTLFEL